VWAARGKAARPFQEPDRPSSLLGLDQQQGRSALQDQPRALPFSGGRFLVSVRWGQANSVYQRLFERLRWIENRFTTLGEAPIPQLKGLEAGMVVFGQNWNDAQVLKTQRQNFVWFAWKTRAPLSFDWQFTRDADDESPESCLGAIKNSRLCFEPRFPTDRDLVRTAPLVREIRKSRLTLQVYKSPLCIFDRTGYTNGDGTSLDMDIETCHRSPGASIELIGACL
jgi:hypothetical protein